MSCQFVRRGSILLVCLAGIICVVLVAWFVTRDDRRVVDVSDCQDILDFLDRLDYRADTWMAGEIPRIAFTCSPARWCPLASDDISIDFRKSMFLMTTAPLVLMANEAVLEDRRMVAGSRKARARVAGARVRDLALRYGVMDDEAAQMTSNHLQELLRRVDSVPPSLALAQGALESGWGTSRFVVEGKALFGQVVWNESGMAPEEPKAELGTYGIRRFDTLLDSVEAYLFNLNSHPAYDEMRQARASRGSDVIPGSVLAEHLESYSEGRRAYVESLLRIIETNSLRQLDNARLRDSPTWIVGPRC